MAFRKWAENRQVTMRSYNQKSSSISQINGKCSENLLWKQTYNIIHLIISFAQMLLHIFFDFVLVLSQCHGQGLTEAICQSEQRSENHHERADVYASVTTYNDPAHW